VIRVLLPSHRSIAPLVTIGLLTIGGTLLFGSLHALLIEPIWRRLVGGLPFAALAAVGMFWCHTELVSRKLIPGGLRGGALFGAVVWLALLPMTALAAALRVSGARASLGGMEPAIETSLAVATGGLIGLFVSRSARVTAACAVCMATVVLAMAGPIAVTVGSTQRWLLFGFLPLYVVTGSALSLALQLTQPKPETPDLLRRAA
jgi:hypothetical protein